MPGAPHLVQYISEHSINNMSHIIDICKCHKKSNWIISQQYTEFIENPQELFISHSKQDDINKIFSLSKCSKRTRSKVWKSLKNDHNDIYQLELLQLHYIPCELPLLLVAHRVYNNEVNES